jgi:opine dehydrogenase
MDEERVAVAEALGFQALRAREWLYLAYDSAGRTLYDAIHNNEGYKGISAPTSLSTRYLWEDVPMSLVPISSLGELLGVPTPTIDHIIDLASIMNETDYRQDGRTVERLGLSGLSVREIQRLVQEGEEVELDA